MADKGSGTVTNLKSLPRDGRRAATKLNQIQDDTCELVATDRLQLWDARVVRAVIANASIKVARFRATPARWYPPVLTAALLHHPSLASIELVAGEQERIEPTPVATKYPTPPVAVAALLAGRLAPAGTHDDSSMVAVTRLVRSLPPSQLRAFELSLFDPTVPTNLDGFNSALRDLCDALSRCAELAVFGIAFCHRAVRIDLKPIVELLPKLSSSLRHLIIDSEFEDGPNPFGTRWVGAISQLTRLERLELPPLPAMPSRDISQLVVQSGVRELCVVPHMTSLPQFDITLRAASALREFTFDDYENYADADPLAFLPEMQAVGASQLTMLRAPPFLQDRAMHALASSLNATRSLTELILTFAAFTPVTIGSVFDALRSNVVLTALCMADVMFCDATVEETAVQLAACLSVNTTLESLSITGTLDDDGLDATFLPLNAMLALTTAIATRNRRLLYFAMPEWWCSGYTVEWYHAVRAHPSLVLHTPCRSTLERYWPKLTAHNPPSDQDGPDSITAISRQHHVCSLCFGSSGCVIDGVCAWGQSARCEWARVGVLLAFISANHSHAYKYSVMPLVDSIVDAALASTGDDPLVAALDLNRFSYSEFARSHVATAANATAVTASAAASATASVGRKRPAPTHPSDEPPSV